MSFGSNVMPKRFGAGRKKPETQAEQMKRIRKAWVAAAASDRRRHKKPKSQLKIWEAARKPKK